MQQRQAEQAMAIMVGLRGFLRLPIMAKDHETAFGADLDPVRVKGDRRRGQRGADDLERQQDQGDTGRNHPPPPERADDRRIIRTSPLLRHDGPRVAEAVQEVNPVGRLARP